MGHPQEARNRVEFGKLTPLSTPGPSAAGEGLDEPDRAGHRPGGTIGKGAARPRVSPPKAGKTMVLQKIANAITENNLECHLMVVLVDERPEEVTDMQRSVKVRSSPQPSTGRRRITPSWPNWPSNGQSGWWRWVWTSSSCSTP